MWLEKCLTLLYHMCLALWVASKKLSCINAWHTFTVLNHTLSSCTPCAQHLWQMHAQRKRYLPLHSAYMPLAHILDGEGWDLRTWMEHLHVTGEISTWKGSLDGGMCSRMARHMCQVHLPTNGFLGFTWCKFSSCTSLFIYLLWMLSSH